MAAKEAGGAQTTGGPACGEREAATHQSDAGGGRPQEEICASGARRTEGKTNRECSPQGTLHLSDQIAVNICLSFVATTMSPYSKPKYW